MKKKEPKDQPFMSARKLESSLKRIKAVKMFAEQQKQIQELAKEHGIEVISL